MANTTTPSSRRRGPLYLALLFDLAALFDLALAFLTLLACLPSAVRVFLGSLLMVFLAAAAPAAFLMFFLAALFCLVVAMGLISVASRGSQYAAAAVETAPARRCARSRSANGELTGAGGELTGAGGELRRADGGVALAERVMQGGDGGGIDGAAAI